MDIKEKVFDLLADKLSFEKSEINENQDFIEDLGADSLDMVEIVMGVEETFNLKVTDEDITGIKTVKDLIEKVKELMGEE